MDGGYFERREYRQQWPEIECLSMWRSSYSQAGRSHCSSLRQWVSNRFAMNMFVITNNIFTNSYSITLVNKTYFKFVDITGYG